MNQRELFFKHVAQTSDAPIAIEVARASGAVLYDRNGAEYIDLIGGISVCNVGHCHPSVVSAITAQASQYLHVLVYGEMIQSPQVRYASLLASRLPASLNSIYFTNSGAEATEGAMKLAKRVTGRTEIIAFNNAYHGSTQGALSILGDEYWRNAFRPLLPDIVHADYNGDDVFDRISERTACVIAETVQAESGVRSPRPEWIKKLRTRCTETGTLLVLDEIQAGFGRTGTLWAFDRYDVVPDILLLGKALGGGMPLGAFIADRSLMHQLAANPVLGHITTFGGHPVSCAAGAAALEALLNEDMLTEVPRKSALFRELLVHPAIREIRGEGLWMAIALEDFAATKRTIDRCLAAGVLTDWFLFAPDCLRIAPPLVITDEQIRRACTIILQSLSNS